jgi:N-formylglutamate deformylase
LKKKASLPILVIIPHGGVQVPDELAAYETLNEFDLFIQSDACANDLFYFDTAVSGMIKTDIARLFIDVDRPYTELAGAGNGVIKKTTLDSRPIYNDGVFPDEIAIANMLKRYYFPFHDAIKKSIEAGGIELILECHTLMAVGPKLSDDPGKPRPLVLLEHMTRRDGSVVYTCGEDIAYSLLEYLEKSLDKEEGTIAQKYAVREGPSEGYILRTYGKGGIPLIRVSISRSLFLNDTYFNPDYLRVDELRINHLKKMLWEALEKFFLKNFR